MKKYVAFAIFTAVIAVFSTLSISAQEMMNAPMMMKKDEKRPIVAIIKADWCPYCKKVDPVMMKLMEDYEEKLNFVIFDVTNEKTTAEAMMTAEKLGLSEFFNEYKMKTSTVAVLKNKEIIYKTSNNGKRTDYIKAFEKVLK